MKIIKLSYKVACRFNASFYLKVSHMVNRFMKYICQNFKMVLKVSFVGFFDNVMTFLNVSACVYIYCIFNKRRKSINIVISFKNQKS